MMGRAAGAWMAVAVFVAFALAIVGAPLVAPRPGRRSVSTPTIPMATPMEPVDPGRVASMDAVSAPGPGSVHPGPRRTVRDELGAWIPALHDELPPAIFEEMGAAA